MQFIRYILRRAPFQPGFSRYKALQSVVLRLRGKATPRPRPVGTRIKFFAQVTIAVLTIPFRLKRLRDGTQVLMYNHANGDAMVAQRRYFLRKYATQTIPAEAIRNVAPEGIREPIYHAGMGIKRLTRLYRAAMLVWCAAFMALFTPTRLNPFWKLRFLHLLLQQIAWHGGGRLQFFFFCFEPDTYLASLVATAYLRDYAPVVISGNSVFYSNNRYLYNPILRLRLCSRFQEEEINPYWDLGWLKVNDIELWGLEEELVIDALTDRTPTVDIGLFSSGGWARTHDLWRSSDLEKLRAYAYNDNPIFVVFQGIIDTVLDLKAKHGLTVKVYFHPYEHHLMKAHGIRPPYLDKLEAHGVIYDTTGKSSLESFFEARIGVAVLSTIIFDRLHYGMQGFVYEGHGIQHFDIGPEYLGAYRKYCYADLKELRQKLEASVTLSC